MTADVNPAVCFWIACNLEQQSPLVPIIIDSQPLSPDIVGSSGRAGKKSRLAFASRDFRLLAQNSR
jgi:hypothetical protein